MASSQEGRAKSALTATPRDVRVEPLRHSRPAFAGASAGHFFCFYVDVSSRLRVNTPPVKLKELLTKTELARRLGLDSRALEKKIQQGEVKPVAQTAKRQPLFDSPK